MSTFYKPTTWHAVSLYLGSYKLNSSWPSRPLATNDLPGCDPGWLTTGRRRREKSVVREGSWRRYLNFLCVLSLAQHSLNGRKVLADSWRKALGGRSWQAGRRGRRRNGQDMQRSRTYLEDVTGEDESNHEGFWKPRSRDWMGCIGPHLIRSCLWSKATHFWERCYWECDHLCMWAWRGGTSWNQSPFAGCVPCPPKQVCPCHPGGLLLLQSRSCRLPTTFRCAHKSTSKIHSSDSMSTSSVVCTDLPSIQATTFTAFGGASVIPNNHLSLFSNYAPPAPIQLPLKAGQEKYGHSQNNG